MVRRFILGVDFDGTLCSNCYPFIGDPNYEIIDRIKKLRNKYDIEIVLITCRHGERLDLACKWCIDKGIVVDRVNENSSRMIEDMGDTRKIYADLYLDDHNYVGDHLYKVANMRFTLDKLEEYLGMVGYKGW